MLGLGQLLWILLCLLPMPGELQAFWLDVPFVEQVENGCGAACVSMVMRYWCQNSASGAPPVPEDAQILKSLASAGTVGARASDLARYLRAQRYQVFAFGGKWDDLEHHLQKGRPLIVAVQQPSGSTQFHFVVVAGMDRTQELLLVNDPARRKLTKVIRSEFEHDWKECGNWTLLALPPNEP